VALTVKSSLPLPPFPKEGTSKPPFVKGAARSAGGFCQRRYQSHVVRFSLVHPRLVLQFGLPTTGELSVVGIGSSVTRVPRVQMSDLRIARLPLSPFVAGVVNLDNLRLGIDLILGIHAFEGYRLQFDFREGRLYLFSE